MKICNLIKNWIKKVIDDPISYLLYSLFFLIILAVLLAIIVMFFKNKEIMIYICAIVSFVLAVLAVFIAIDKSKSDKLLLQAIIELTKEIQKLNNNMISSTINHTKE